MGLRGDPGSGKPVRISSPPYRVSLPAWLSPSPKRQAIPSWDSSPRGHPRSFGLAVARESPPQAPRCVAALCRTVF